MKNGTYKKICAIVENSIDWNKVKKISGSTTCDNIKKEIVDSIIKLTLGSENKKERLREDGSSDVIVIIEKLKSDTKNTLKSVNIHLWFYKNGKIRVRLGHNKVRLDVLYEDYLEAKALRINTRDREQEKLRARHWRKK